MKKILLMAVAFVMGLTMTAQTYNNPRHSSNNSRLSVVKVERTSEYTMVHLRYNGDENSRCSLDAYPTLTDEATGKRYQATGALNFKWGTKYKNVVNFKVEFPPLPRNTSVVTFREVKGTKNPFVVSNIALPIQNNQRPVQQQKPAPKKTSNSNEYYRTYNNPSQKKSNDWSVIKVIRSNEYTIVHLKSNSYDAKLDLTRLRLVDEDTDRAYKATKALNFTSQQGYSDAVGRVFKVQFPVLPKTTSEVSLKEYFTLVGAIQIPL